MLAPDDVDGDGDVDLVFGENLYLNDGAGTFTDVTVTRMPIQFDPSFAVAVGDVDGDQDDDLVIGSYVNRLYLNLRHQLDAPYLLRVGEPYQLDVYVREEPNQQPAVAFPFLSLGAAAIPVPPLGVLGIDPRVAVRLPAVVLPSSSGAASIAFRLVDDPSLFGIPIYAQAIVEEGTRLRLTNVTRDVIFR